MPAAPQEDTVAGKGGRVPGILNNDIRVVTFPDGRRYAVAVFTRARHAFDGEEAVQRMIGVIGAAAIGQLRRREG